jgi:hypothetical protein
VGAERVHEILVGWRRGLQGRAGPSREDTPEPVPATGGI